jgi:hypothetical protein
LLAAGLWQSRQLYVSTPTSIHAVFADPVTAFVQEVQVRGGAALVVDCPGSKARARPMY